MWGCSLIEIEKYYSSSYLNYFKVQIKRHEINGYIIENKGVYTLSEKGKSHVSQQQQPKAQSKTK